MTANPSLSRSDVATAANRRTRWLRGTKGKSKLADNASTPTPPMTAERHQYKAPKLEPLPPPGLPLASPRTPWPSKGRPSTRYWAAKTSADPPLLDVSLQGSGLPPEPPNGGGGSGGGGGGGASGNGLGGAGLPWLLLVAATAGVIWTVHKTGLRATEVESSSFVSVRRARAEHGTRSANGATEPVGVPRLPVLSDAHRLKRLQRRIVMTEEEAQRGNAVRCRCHLRIIRAPLCPAS
jgi:hypothetical protein